MDFLLAASLGTATGLNPYVTVAITALVAWRNSSLLIVGEPFNFVGTPTMFMVALLLLPIDLFADKFPGSGGLMDRFGWIVRPLSGGILGGAVITATGPNVIAGLFLGAAAAALVHGLRLRVRRRVQWRLFGFGRIVFGAYSDLASGILTMLAILSAPLGATIAAVILGTAAFVDHHWGCSKST